MPKVYPERSRPVSRKHLLFSGRIDHHRRIGKKVHVPQLLRGAKEAEFMACEIRGSAPAATNSG
jgi:hypothetical protein